MNKKVILNFFKILSLGIITGIFSVCGVNPAFAAGVPNTLSYQGRLTDTNGSPVSDAGTYYVCFSIWDSAPTSGGVKLWPALTPNAIRIYPTNGVFNTQVGGGADSLVGYDFSATSPEYLQVGISTTSSCIGAEILGPNRQPIDATAYARVAENVYGAMLKTDTANNRVQVGTGAGGGTPVLLSLDSKNTSTGDTVGTTCGSGTYLNGDMWYNSNSGVARICSSNLIKSLVGLSNQYFDVTGPTVTGGVKTFTFPDASASVLTTANLVTVAQGGTGTSTLIANNVILGNGTNAPLFVAPGAAGNVLVSNGTTWTSAAPSGGAAAGADTQIQFNNAGAFGGSSAFTWNNTTNTLGLGGVDTEIMMTGITNEPTPPTTGNVLFYAKSIAGKMSLKFVGPSGLDENIQPHLAFDKIGWWNPQGNSVASSTVGITPLVVIGTATARTVATTNLFTRMRRIGYVSAATANYYAGLYTATAQFTVGDGTGLGGFFFVTRFGSSDATTQTSAREFVGMSSSVAAPTNGTAVEPSTLTNSIGVGFGTADTNLKIFYGGSAAQTPIDLGANFPKNTTTNTDMYELVLYAPFNANNTVGYRVTRLNTNVSVSGTLAAATPGTQLPASTTLLAPRMWRENTTTAASGLDIASIYISTDQ